MMLSDKQIQELRDALLDAYRSRDELRMMLRTEVGEQLEMVADGENLRILVFNLITWAERTDRVDDLLHGAARGNPGNRSLQQLVQAWTDPKSASPTSAVAATLSQPAPAGPVSIDLFLSYSRKDRAAMHVVQAVMRDAGLSVWTDEGLEPGTHSWRMAIEEAIEQAPALVVLLSPDAKSSLWVGNEVQYAQELGKRIFPVLIVGEGVRAVPVNLVNVQRVDGRGRLHVCIKHELLPAVLHHLGRPAAAASSMGSEFAASIGIEWMTIPAGEFLMGDDWDISAKPKQKVYLPEYRIAKYPVTNGQYQAFVKATSWKEPEHWNNGMVPKGKEDHPVVYISRDDAIAFCQWAGTSLPTEAQWEKAARGTDGRTYPWGHNLPTRDLCNFGDNVGDTTAVGSHPKGTGPYGVMDMVGNTWEWTSSLYAPYPYDANDGRENPEEHGGRVLRGGSWLDHPDSLAASFRNQNSPDFCSDNIGFRLVASTMPVVDGVSQPSGGSAAAPKRYDRTVAKSSSDTSSQPAKQPPAAKAAPSAARAVSQISSSFVAASRINVPSARLGIEWVTVPAGEFTMGDENQSSDEKPRHKVYVPEYQISKYPVTNLQYMAFVKNTSQSAPRHWKGEQIPTDKENHPVVYVSWDDAIAFCKWVGVCLPTEAQWEKAARGKDGRKYPWGNIQPTNELCNFGNTIRDTTAVGSYPKGASPYGLLDMAGNVWEWTSSREKSYPYNARDGREDPQTRGDRVLRGGSWRCEDYLIVAAIRLRHGPDYVNSDTGFRVVVCSSP